MKQYININSAKYESNTVVVMTYYQKGGMNYWHGTEEARGIYLTLNPMNVTQHNGYQTESGVLGTGVKVKLLELKRKSQKQLDRVDALVEEYAERMAREFANGNDTEVRNMMWEMIDILEQ